MAETHPVETLVKLSESKLTVANQSEDIRGRMVLDKNAIEVGKVDDLMIDDREHKVRLPQVESGGFLGLGGIGRGKQRPAGNWMSNRSDAVGLTRASMALAASGARRILKRLR